MMNEIPRYPTKQLDSKITLCVSSEMKHLWDKYIREKKMKLPEALRTSLSDILLQAAVQINTEGTGGS
jgi:hypothetical protein